MFESWGVEPAGDCKPRAVRSPEYVAITCQQPYFSKRCRPVSTRAGGCIRDAFHAYSSLAMRCDRAEGCVDLGMHSEEADIDWVGRSPIPPLEVRRKLPGAGCERRRNESPTAIYPDCGRLYKEMSVYWVPLAAAPCIRYPPCFDAQRRHGGLNRNRIQQKNKATGAADLPGLALLRT